MTQIILDIQKILELSEQFRSTILQRIVIIKQIKSLPKTTKNRLVIQQYLKEGTYQQAEKPKYSVE